MSGPVLRVVRGDATPEEIAALVAVVSARAAPAGPEPEPERRSRWADRAALVSRALPAPGPGAWRAALFP